MLILANAKAISVNASQIGTILDRVQSLEDVAPVPGEPGPQGEPGMDGQQGDQGLQGEPGEPLAVGDLTDDQIKTLANRISSQLPPIYFEKEDMESGTVVRESVHLGEGYRFRLFPPE